jgi:hypothetical protein
MGMGGGGGNPGGIGMGFPVYQPSGQGSVDQSWNQFYQGMAGPAQAAAPGAAQNLVSNPYAMQAQLGSNLASLQGANIGQGQLYQGANLAATSENALPLWTDIAGAAGLGGSGAQPYSDIVANTISNPFFGQSLAGAQQGAQYGGQTAAGAMQASQQLFGQMPGTLAAGNQVFQTGMDPQSALYNRSQQQTTDQTRAALAAAGLGGSPYAAGVEGQTMSNFNIDWQNNQLNRQMQGLQGLEGANASALGLGTGGFNLGQGASALAASSAGLPSGAYLGQQNAIANALNTRLNATNAATGGISNLFSGAGQGMTAGAGLENTGLGTGMQTANAPYQTSIGQAQNSLALPQWLMGSGLQYLNLGQNAAYDQGQLDLGAEKNQLEQQQLQTNVLGSALGGLGKLAGAGLSFLPGGQAAGAALGGLSSAGTSGKLGGS